ncbi:hypothetical protein JW752_05335 [Candidatus Peregrinibacteria bacterium]|nr:hypothetical protein [Candidatus Peregrinibacteria bacterium]
MTQEKPTEEACEPVDPKNQESRQPLNPHYLAVAMGQANMTYVRALATLLVGKKEDNPDTHE